MELSTISAVRRASSNRPWEGQIHAQVESVVSRTTRDQKPYLVVELVDAEDRMTLRVWSDHPAFRQCSDLPPGAFVEVRGSFSSSGPFGLEAQRWELKLLKEKEVQALLAGPEDLRHKQEEDYRFIEEKVTGISDPRLAGLARSFLEQHGDRFRRAAAARTYHHARRGGLLEHTAQMMRSCAAITEAYPMLNHGLLLAGVLFHDCGKLWETCAEEHGFAMPYSETGELGGTSRSGSNSSTNSGAIFSRRPGRRTGKISSPHRSRSGSTCSTSSHPITANANSVRPSNPKHRKRSRSTTSTTSTRKSRCSPPATRPLPSSVLTSTTGSARFPATWWNN